MNLFRLMEFVRLVAFAGIGSVLFYLAVNGHARRDPLWLFWSVHGVYYSTMLYLAVLNQFYAGYAYLHRHLITVPVLLVLAACVYEIWRQPQTPRPRLRLRWRWR
jgi:hypothetical protein